MHAERTSGEGGPRDALRRRVERGTLVLTTTGGAIRAHTTLLTKQLQTRYGVHIAFNELVADPTVNPERLRGAFAVLLRETERIEAAVARAGRDLTRHPVHAVFKVQPYHVTTAERLDLFSLAPNAVFSVRDPMQTSESILKGMLRIAFLSTAAGTLPPIDLRAVVRPGADLTHVRGPGFTSGTPPTAELTLGSARGRLPLDPVGQHVRHMIETRDYSSLGDGFVRFFSYYPVLDRPDLKRGVWDEMRGRLGTEPADAAARSAGWDRWTPMVEALAATPSTEFHRLPDVLAEPLRFRRTGWQALADVIAALDSRPHPHAIVDSLDLLLAPDACLGHLAERFGLPARTAAPSVPYATFDPGFRDLPIAQALFERVRLQDDVEVPSGPPVLPPERFPEFLLPEIRRYLEIWARALRSPHRLRCLDESVDALLDRPIASDGTTLGQVEPTALYMRAALAGDAAAPTRRVLRQQATTLTTWFDWMDEATGRAGR